MAKIYVSSVIGAPIEKVWARIRDFNALPVWHPMVARSAIEGGRASEAVGAVRDFSLKDGGNLREQLLGLSDAEHCCTYSILVSPMPVTNYVATLRLRPITDGGTTFAEWSAEFDVPAAEEKATVEAVTGVFQTGFDSLKKHFGA